MTNRVGLHVINFDIIKYSSSSSSSVLPKGRYFTAISGTKAEVLPKGKSSTANSGAKVAVLLGMNRCCRFPLLSSPTFSLASEQTLKDPRSPSVEVRRVDSANWTLKTSPKFATGVRYQFHQGFEQIRNPEIPITLRLLVSKP